MSVSLAWVQRIMRGGCLSLVGLSLAACTTAAPHPAAPSPPAARDGSSSPPARVAPTLSVSGGNPGGHASATVHAAPDALCTLTYRTPDGNVARPSGLEPHRTDGRGYAEWRWYLTTTTPPGIGTAMAACDGLSSLAVHVIIGGVQEPPGSASHGPTALSLPD